MCVREWLDSKKQSQRQDGVYSYYWEELTCELCKQPLQLRNQVLTNEKGTSVKVTREYFLLNYKVPQKSKYMVLESDINCLSKAIHVIDFDYKKDYKVGRRVNNDITVSDISVSRAQASIQLRDQQIFVEDLDSKFGTFVKIQGMLKISSESMGLGKSNKFNFVVPVQVEKKCFFIRPTHRYSWWLRGCCSLCPTSCCSCTQKKSRKAPGQLSQHNNFVAGESSRNAKAGGEAEFDHFLDVYDRYPEDAYRILLPHLYEIELMQQLQKEKMIKQIASKPSHDEEDMPTQKKPSSPAHHANNKTHIPDELNMSAYEDQEALEDFEDQPDRNRRARMKSSVPSNYLSGDMAGHSDSVPSALHRGASNPSSVREGPSSNQLEDPYGDDPYHRNASHLSDAPVSGIVSEAERIDEGSPRHGELDYQFAIEQ